MEIELIENAGDPTKLKEIVHMRRCSDIVDLIVKIFQQQNPQSDVCLLEALTCGVREHEELLEICEQVIDHLWSIQLSGDYRSATSLFLGVCIEHLEDWKVERLCFRIIQRLKEESLEKFCVFEVFGKSLVRLEKSTVILTPLTHPLCSAGWNGENALSLLEAIRDYPLSINTREKILTKALEVMNTAEASCISGFCKAILLFACVKTMPLVIQHICSYPETNASTQQKLILENMIGHIQNLCSGIEQFGWSILHTLKNLPEELKLSECFFEISLIVIPIEPLRSSVLRLLCNSIRIAFSDNVLVSESSFLRGLCDAKRDPAALILHLCGKCADTYRIHLTRGLTLLGFGLIRLGTSSSISSGASNFRKTRSKIAQRSIKPNTSPFTAQDTTGARLVRLADESLTQLFRTCPSTRDDIVNEIVDLIWSESSRPVALHLVDLLADLVALCPMEVACRASRFDPILDSIGLLPQELAIGLVHAVLPLIRAGNQIDRQYAPTVFNTHPEGPTLVEDHPINRVRNRLFTALRKAASSPRVLSRRNAVACFLLLLKHLKVSVTAFRSASQNSSGSLSQFSLMSQTQATQNNPGLLYTQLQSTQIARQAVTLPCDASQNEALCTEIVGVLHRVIFSAFFRSQTGSMLEDPENRLKSDIYWGLCEVVTRNRGLVEPVVTLYVRLLVGCLSPGFLRHLKQTHGLASLTVPAVLEPGTSQSSPAMNAVLPLSLEHVVQSNAETNEIRRTEHPEIVAWCLQLVLTLPMFASAWRRYRLNRTRSRDDSSESTQSSEGFSQFTQSTVAGSIECGRSVSSSLFAKSVTLLLALSDSLRNTPLDEFGLTAEMDFGSNTTGKVNRERANVLLGLYDACLEFELKAPLDSMRKGGITDQQMPTMTTTRTPSTATTWTRVRQLFARRVQLRNLVLSKLPPVSGSTTGNGSLLLVPVTLHDRSAIRPGLLAMGLISAADQSRLPQVLRASFHSEEAGPLAHHMLITIAARLSHFGHSTRGRVPYAYRDQLVQTLIPLLQHLIRYYNHKLSSLVAPSCPETPISNVTQPAGASGANNPEMEAKARITASVSAAALSVLDTAFALILDQLGTERLHHLIVLLYPVVCQPQYRDPVPDPDSGDAGDELIDSAVITEDSDSGSCPIPEISPAQALSALIKLIKGWITKLLNSGSSTTVASTQMTVHHSAVAIHTRDLVVLLPLLVRLCRARAQIGSTETAGCNALIGLDRVLAWLVRLMRAGPPPVRDAGAMINAARVQLIGQAVWLAHLVGTFPDATNRTDEDRDQNTSMDFILGSLASDLHQTVGDTSGDHDSSIISCGGSESTVNFPMITRSTALSLVPLLCSTVRQLMIEFEWLLTTLTTDLGGRLRSATVTSLASTALENDAKLVGNSREESLCVRLVSLGETMAKLLQSAFPIPSAHVDSLLELGAKLFNFLTQLTKYYLRVVRTRSGRFPVLFERVVRVFGKVVSPAAYSFITYIQTEESEKLKSLQEKQSIKKQTKSGKKDGLIAQTKKIPVSNISQNLISRSIKESRSIPQLVFAIEQFERFLLQLSKKSKINLMNNVKLAVSRDFRINQAAVQAQLERSATLSLSSDSEAAEEVLETNSNHEEVQEQAYSPRAPHSPNVETDAEGTTANHSHLVMTSEPDELIIGDKGDVENRQPANSTMSHTPAWGRALQPDATRRSLLNRPAPSASHIVTINKSKRLGPRN